jgi:serine/threonine-protein kinase HipA
LELLDEMIGLLAPALERTRLALIEQVAESVSTPITADAAQRAEQVRELL